MSIFGMQTSYYSKIELNAPRLMLYRILTGEQWLIRQIQKHVHKFYHSNKISQFLIDVKILSDNMAIEVELYFTLK